MEKKEISIDINRLLGILQKYILLIISVTIITTVISYVYCNYFLVKKYSSSIVFYLENKENTDGLMTSETLNSGQKLVQSTIVVLKEMDSIAEKTLETLNLSDKYSVKKLKSAINMQNVSNTTVLKITLTLEDKDILIPMLDTYARFCLEEFERVINSGTIKAVNAATSDFKPVYPVPQSYITSGFAIGFVGIYLIVFARELLNVKVKSDDDLFAIYNIPVFSEVLSFNSKSKGHYSYYSYE